MTDTITVLAVPSSWVITSTLPKKDRRSNIILLEVPPADDTPRLIPSKMHKTVFLNLTLGAITQQAGAAAGCSSRLSYTPAFEELMIRAAATVRVSAECRPTSEQLNVFASLISIPTEYGDAVYRMLLHRVSAHFDNKINVGELPNALVVTNGGVAWKQHTAEWKVDGKAIGLKALKAQVSSSIRGRKVEQMAPAGRRIGWKKIIDGAVGLLAQTGMWDVNVSSGAAKESSGGQKRAILGSATSAESDAEAKSDTERETESETESETEHETEESESEAELESETPEATNKTPKTMKPDSKTSESMTFASKAADRAAFQRAVKQAAAHLEMACNDALSKVNDALIQLRSKSDKQAKKLTQSTRDLRRELEALSDNVKVYVEASGARMSNAEAHAASTVAVLQKQSKDLALLNERVAALEWDLVQRKVELKIKAELSQGE